MQQPWEKLSESDHNILYAKFKLEVQRKQKTERVEVFDSLILRNYFMRRQIVFKRFETSFLLRIILKSIPKKS